MSGFNNLFKAIGSLLELAQKMDASGQNEFVKSGTFKLSPADTEKLQGVYGFSIKLGENSKVKTFGNLRVDSDNLTLDSQWEPLIDVFDEPDHVLIVAELPGVSEDQVGVRVENGVLKLHAPGQRRDYRKDVALPDTALVEQIETSCRNGILEIRIPKGQV